MSPPRTSAFNMFFDPASAEGMVKTEIKAKTQIISANFFHIKDPSFRMVLFVFYSFRRRVQRIYSIKNREGGNGSEKRRQNIGQSHIIVN